MQFNVYVDGTWLFNQCLRGRILANRMEFPENSFRLDFKRLLDLFISELGTRVAEIDNEAAVEIGSLYFYTAIFYVPDEPDPDWPDVSAIRRGSEFRRRFADDAIAAGFSDEGIFSVQLRTWMIEKLADHRYQEKMVDTSLVARLDD